ncbi:hypothetical protein DFS33DRAFT_93820 [Desarmillaria ectypa]|nr:hypothetical protein DFS33DRAFT_93820 [Desarmillaria ectypa]
MTHKTGDATSKMTRFQAFQTEIEDIRNRELAKRRVQGAVAMAKEKDSKDSPSKGKGKADERRKVIVLGEPVANEKENKGPPSKGKEKADEHRNVVVLSEHTDGTAFSEVEEEILTLLQSKLPNDYESARDMIAALITQNHGEYVLRIGSQPPRALLFSGELTDSSDGWTRFEKTVQDLDTLRPRVTDAVEEIGGKVKSPLTDRAAGSYSSV